MRVTWPLIVSPTQHLLSEIILVGDGELHLCGIFTDLELMVYIFGSVSSEHNEEYADEVESNEEQGELFEGRGDTGGDGVKEQFSECLK